MKMITYTIYAGLFLMTLRSSQDPSGKKEIQRNGMSVKWHHSEEQVFFEVTAPTKGWVTIGFNETDNITNAYLLMGRVQNQQTEVVEHFTSEPGNYRPLSTYNVPTRVEYVEGYEGKNFTSIKFSLPAIAVTRYHKKLTSGTCQFLIIAYSREDDFQHHSIMRSSLKIEL